MTEISKNQGEGDRESAQRYNEAAHRTAEHLSEEQLRGGENLTNAQRRELERAEQDGKSRAKGEDPMVARDR
jgi:hypothetical protein